MKNTSLLAVVLLAATSVTSTNLFAQTTTTPLLSISDEYGNKIVNFYGEVFAGSNNEFVGVGYVNYGMVTDYAIAKYGYAGEETEYELQDAFFSFKYDNYIIDNSQKPLRSYEAWNGTIDLWSMYEGTSFQATGDYYADRGYIEDEDNSYYHEASANLGNSDGEFVVGEWLTSYGEFKISSNDSFFDGFYIQLNMDLGEGANGYDYHGYSAPPSSVPVPGAVWLFGTGIIGLVARSKG